MANTVIQLKRSSATGNIPNVGDINHGELAINYADGKLYYKTDLNQIESIYTPNQYETLNVNNTLLVPTTPSEILSLNSANGIRITACTATDTIVVDENLSPIINLAYNTANVAFNKANTANITYTASNTTPVSPKLGDEWYKIDSDILYIYSTDDISTFWLDITSAKITTNVVQLQNSITGDLAVSGNVSANYFIGDGSLLTGISSSSTVSGPTGPTGPSGAESTVSGPTGPTGPSGTASTVPGPTGPTGPSGAGGSPSVYSNSYVLTATTSNSTETEAYVNGVAGTRMVVPTDKTVFYTADITCRRTDTTGDHAAWHIKGLATNASGVVTDVGSLYEIIVARTDGNFVVDFRADGANNTVGVYFTGVTGKTISWKCAVNVVEV
jgi:hypothetical protein